MASPWSPDENIEDEVYDRTGGEEGVVLVQSRALVAAPTCPEDDNYFVAPSERKTPVKPPPSKRLKAASNDDEEDEMMDEDDKTPSKAAGRGRGGRGAGATPGERGRGLGGRGFTNFGERKDPPHKGEKEVPEGAPDCLAGLTFVISGTLDSLEREEAVDLIKRYGGRVTSAISKNTSYLLADEDLGGVKSNKAKYLGVPFLTEDNLFDMIWKSKPAAILEPLDESLLEEYGVASAEGDEEVSSDAENDGMASPWSPDEHTEDEVYDRVGGEEGAVLVQSRALVAVPTPPAAPTCPEDDDDFVAPSERKTPVKPPPSKRLKAASNDDEEDERMDEDDKTPSKATGRGRGGKGAGATPGERGRGLGGRGFMNFGERKDPPHKGEKEVPEGAPDCLAGLTFVISGTLDSLERKEAGDLIKRHGGRVTGTITKRTSYLLADEDLGGVKSNKAKYPGVPFLTEDNLFDMIWKSNPAAILEPLDESLPEEYGVASAEGDEEVSSDAENDGMASPWSPDEHTEDEVYDRAGGEEGAVLVQSRALVAVPTPPAAPTCPEDDDDSVAPSERKTPVKPPPSKMLKAASNDDEEDERMDEDDKTPSKATGRGRGGKGAGATPGERGRGLGGRGFMNFGERKDPPHKGEKEVPEGAPDCLAGLTFVISGTLDSLERKEAGDLIKRHGGRVTGTITKKTSYLLADEDLGGVKSNKAKYLGVPFLTEDNLFDMIWKSNPAKAPVNKHEDRNSSEKGQPA